MRRSDGYPARIRRQERNRTTSRTVVRSFPPLLAAALVFGAGIGLGLAGSAVTAALICSVLMGAPIIGLLLRHASVPGRTATIVVHFLIVLVAGHALGEQRKSTLAAGCESSMESGTPVIARGRVREHGSGPRSASERGRRARLTLEDLELVFGGRACRMTRVAMFL